MLSVVMSLKPFISFQSSSKCSIFKKHSQNPQNGNVIHEKPPLIHIKSYKFIQNHLKSYSKHIFGARKAPLFGAAFHAVLLEPWMKHQRCWCISRPNAVDWPETIHSSQHTESHHTLPYTYITYIAIYVTIFMMILGCMVSIIICINWQIMNTKKIT